MINCEVLSPVYFAMARIPRSCAYLHSLGNLAFGSGLNRASKRVPFIWQGSDVTVS